MADIILDCIRCGSAFVWTIYEQNFFSKRGFSQPKRCKICRPRKNSKEPNQIFDSGFASRFLYRGVCSICAAETAVPFEPSQAGDRDVLCNVCYRNREG